MAMTSSTTSAPVGSTLHPRAGRRCHNVLNALHTTHYFSPDVGRELAPLGITHPKAVNFAIRAAALGAVGAGTVTATFFNYKPDTVARFVPEIWRTAAPEDVLAARLRAVDTTLRRLLGDEAVASPEMAEAARLALRATEACSPSGRPLYAAHAALAVPDEPHLAYWHAATLLREHRGDGHLAALLDAELDPVEALVSHTATGKSMTPTWNLNTRGWTRDDWDAAVERLRGRGLVAADGGYEAQIAEVEVPTLDGPEEVEIEPGTQSGEVIRLGGRGMPRMNGRGRGCETAAGGAGTPSASAIHGNAKVAS